MSWNWSRLLVAVILANLAYSCSLTHSAQVAPHTMAEVYAAVRTPYKYGIVFQHPDTTKLMDSPSIFRWKDRWMMSYIVYDGRGYETWLAESDDLLHWTSRGRILSFTDTSWDSNQKAGYMALLDPRWGGSYAPQSFQNKYWMSYLGGSASGYEAGRLGVGIAHTQDPGEAREWTRLSNAVLAANDSDARWFDNATIFKSTIIRDDRKLTGKPFVMYYNASGDTARYESIAMAFSEDLLHWKRLGESPLISRRVKGTICGDAQIAQLGKLYIMFYFGAFWNGSGKAFDRFACSYDLVHWTEWTGEDLVQPSAPYDAEFAHKPFVIKWKDTVYHFYTAVGNKGRVIAVATSVPLRE